MKKVAVVGTMGVPAQYGGFETLVENLIDKKTTSNIRYTVYCSGKSYTNHLESYNEALLKYIPLQANGAQSVLYDMVSIIRAVKEHDVILILGVSGCIFLPLFRIFSNKRLVINIDGLEHRRDKWGRFAKAFLKYSEKMAVKYADVIVSDNKGIQDYVWQEYGKQSELIAYGGDHVLCDVSSVEDVVLQNLSLKGKDYSFSVCRIEPENNVHIALEAFRLAHKELVVVGNWDKSQYGKELQEKYAKCENIHLISPIYDLKVLNVLRSNCSFYIHGHSAGGTNPSLVEAMFFGKPILAYDVLYNRETTEGKASYYKTVEELRKLLSESYNVYDERARAMLEIAHRRYRWADITKHYESLY